MKIDKLIDAIGAIAPEYIEEAELWDGADAKRRRNMSGYARWRKILLPVAASLALVIVGGTAGFWYLGSVGQSDSSTGSGASADCGPSVGYDAGTADAGGTSDGGAMSGGSDTGEGSDTRGGAAYDTAREEEGQQDQAAVTQEAVADKDASQAGTAGGGEMIVNEADSFSLAIADHAAPAYEKYYTAEEMEDYYGIRILPGELPQGLTPAKTGETPYVIGYDENDAVMDDNCRLVFSDDSSGRELEIAARTVNVGQMRGFDGQNMEPSYLYGQEVTVARLGDECLAIYEKQGVTVTVWSRGLNDEELRAVLAELLEG